ncbi:uncharacterized protein PSFLO_01964 [Pseudozyma flocculosa]|uniref:Uncharacterized protein n=1 Tax=Pseudozyma flocculosa TaxID=84751 RepID=A0A5C3EW73_9BASI|nr:uncharacterized protein PSFLO_01964 [Pseudozyma flocculosa]
MHGSPQRPPLPSFTALAVPELHLAGAMLAHEPLAFASPDGALWRPERCSRAGAADASGCDARLAGKKTTRDSPAQLRLGPPICRESKVWKRALWAHWARKPSGVLLRHPSEADCLSDRQDAGSRSHRKAASVRAFAGALPASSSASVASMSWDGFQHGRHGNVPVGAVLRTCSIASGLGLGRARTPGMMALPLRRKPMLAQRHFGRFPNAATIASRTPAAPLLSIHYLVQAIAPLSTGESAVETVWARLPNRSGTIALEAASLGDREPASHGLVAMHSR